MSFSKKLSRQVCSLSPLIDETPLGSSVSNFIVLSTAYHYESVYIFPAAQCTSDIHIRDFLDFSYLSNNSYEYENQGLSFRISRRSQIQIQQNYL